MNRYIIAPSASQDLNKIADYFLSDLVGCVNVNVTHHSTFISYQLSIISFGTTLFSPNNSEFVNDNALIAELKQARIKHNPEAILRIARKPDGKIVFLEVGNSQSGWQHILEKHADDFTNRGISINLLQDALIIAVTRGRMIGIQGANRTIYEFQFQGVSQYMSVNVSSNGYIVSANPTPQKLIRRLIQER